MKITAKLTLLLLLFTCFVSACQKQDDSSLETLIATGDAKDIHAKKSLLSDQKKSLARQIARLDSVLEIRETGKKLPLITIFDATPEPFDHFVELQGSVKTKQNVLIYPEMPGSLLRINARKGSRVSAGQVLAVIDDGGMSSQILQMKVNRDLAKTTFERQERLWAQKVGSEIQYLQAKSNLEAQNKAIQRLESQLDKYNIRAPFSGTIDDVFKEPGMVVAPGVGAEVFRLISLSNMYVEVDVPESYLPVVTKGKRVKVFLPVLNDTIKTKIRQVSHFIDPANRSFSVEIPLPNRKGQIKPNLTAQVFINDYSRGDAILVPQSVISENAAGEQFLFVTTEENADKVAKVSRRIIRTGRTKGDRVEVVSGLSGGQNVVKEGARVVRDGQEVKILKH